jgi:hypothetical protein
MVEVFIAIGVSIAGAILAIISAVRYKRTHARGYRNKPFQESELEHTQRKAQERIAENTRALADPGDDLDDAVSRVIREGRKRANDDRVAEVTVSYRAKPARDGKVDK